MLIAVSIIALRRAGDVAPAAGAGAVHDRGAGEHVVWQVRGREERASPHRWRCLPTDGTSCSLRAPNPDTEIWLRPVASLAAGPIPGTEDGIFPFWSPDSRFIGFFAAGKLKKIPIAGGPPMVLADATAGRGGSWSRDNVILFTPSVPTALSSACRAPAGCRLS